MHSEKGLYKIDFLIELIFISSFTDGMVVVPNTPSSFLLKAYLMCLCSIIPFIQGETYSIPLVLSPLLQFNMMYLSSHLKSLNVTKLTTVFLEPVLNFGDIVKLVTGSYDVIARNDPIPGTPPNMVGRLQMYINNKSMLLYKDFRPLRTSNVDISLGVGVGRAQFDRNPILVEVAGFYHYTIEQDRDYVKLIPAQPQVKMQVSSINVNSAPQSPLLNKSKLPARSVTLGEQDNLGAVKEDTLGAAEKGTLETVKESEQTNKKMNLSLGPTPVTPV
jgi:hypothetical protein